MRTALFVCADDIRSGTVIHALKSEHDIWHVTRQRDAMAYLARHQPETVVIDLDLLGQDALTILDAIRQANGDSPSFVIGLSRNPEQLPPELALGFDQILTHA